MSPNFNPSTSKWLSAIEKSYGELHLRSSMVNGLSFHAWTAFLFTKSDTKTILLPVVSPHNHCVEITLAEPDVASTRSCFCAVHFLRNNIADSFLDLGTGAREHPRQPDDLAGGRRGEQEIPAHTLEANHIRNGYCSEMDCPCSCQ